MMSKVMLITETWSSRNEHLVRGHPGCTTAIAFETTKTPHTPMRVPLLELINKICLTLTYNHLFVYSLISSYIMSMIKVLHSKSS